MLKVIPDIISQWAQEERGEDNHCYTLSKDEIDFNAFCLSSVLVVLFPPACYFFFNLSPSSCFPVIQRREMKGRERKRLQRGEKY